jgi:hypothetical protein
MKPLFKFYLKNFRVIHHIFFILMTFGFLKLLSLGFTFYDVVFTLTPFGTFLQVVILCLCFYFNEKALNKVGLTDEYMSNELEKIENKKRGK